MTGLGRIRYFIQDLGGRNVYCLQRNFNGIGMRKGERVTQRRQTKVARQSRLGRDQCECASRSAILTGRFAEVKPEFDYAFSNQKQHKYRVATFKDLALTARFVAF